ncbi:MAG: stalk domain-containing protein [Peptococcaceae bacterium]
MGKLKRCVQSLVFLTAVMIGLGASSPIGAAENIKLVIDRNPVDVSPLPLIENGRTLVPVRFVSERLGAVVNWNAETNTVQIIKGERSVLLRIDNRLVEFNEGTANYSLIDVPPKLSDGRTFVPLRLVSNALGVRVEWDDSSRTVNIDSATSVSFTPFFDISLPMVKAGQNVNGLTYLQLTTNSILPAGAAEVRYQLLDPQTGKGPVVARGNNLQGMYGWLPDPAYNGRRVLTAAVYDQSGGFLAGNAVPIELAVAPQVSLTGVTPGQTVQDHVDLGANLNFLAEYVKYEVTNVNTGKITVTEEADPQGTFTWTPQVTDNGPTAFKVSAYDSLGQVYASPVITVNTAVERSLVMRGVAQGTVIEKPVTLWVSRNFPITQVEYILRNRGTGQETILAQRGYEGYTWFPGPELAGSWEVLARVKDTAGNSHVTEAVPVQLKGTAKLLLESVGPNQILTAAVKLKSVANVPLTAIEYRLLSTDNKTIKVIARGDDAAAEYTWTPGAGESGQWKIQAVGTTAAGEKITSEAVPVKIYLAKIYSPVPVTAKNDFLGFASQLAVKSQNNTGMSAALQTAQAILETGWGQQTPVDKYTGQLSYNLFGIKGTGSAGSITSNTWEEYNGNSFRVDAQFRAYHNPEESWNDHKQLLLTAARYEPYREVMHNSTMGAWALKRAGYATDSKYPLKLIDIIKRYDLQLLDEKGI